jgi:hypothetical protein
MRDWHILTNGILTYTADNRFSVLHKEGSYDWVLQIKYVQERDAGLYECQVRRRRGCTHMQYKLTMFSGRGWEKGRERRQLGSRSARKYGVASTIVV